MYMYKNDEYEYIWICYYVNKRCVLVAATICFHSIGGSTESLRRWRKIGQYIRYIYIYIFIYLSVSLSLSFFFLPFSFLFLSFFFFFFFSNSISHSLFFVSLFLCFCTQIIFDLFFPHSISYLSLFLLSFWIYTCICILSNIYIYIHIFIWICICKCICIYVCELLASRNMAKSRETWRKVAKHGEKSRNS